MTKKQYKRNWNEQIERKNKLANKHVAQWEQTFFAYTLVQTIIMIENHNFENVINMVQLKPKQKNFNRENEPSLESNSNIQNTKC